jgi:hypothetical protein
MNVLSLKRIGLVVVLTTSLAGLAQAELSTSQKQAFEERMLKAKIQSYLDQVADHRFQFDMAMKAKNYMDACGQSQMIKVLYMQLRDQDNYADWSKLADQVCTKLAVN